MYMAIETTVYSEGNIFPALCCNTDAANVKIYEDNSEDGIVRAGDVAACIEEYHRILKLVLSEDVPVDHHFGLGLMGIYHEPLERVLEYLSLSMSKDQVVNASIDEDTKWALIPGNVLNAACWYERSHPQFFARRLLEDAYS
jgi:hypothetical protein